MSARTVVVLAACWLVAASCSISVDEAARPVDDAPTDLLDPTTTTAAATTEPDEDDSFELVLMYLNSNGRRVPVSRPRDTAPSVQDVLDGLVTQPSETEQTDPENPIITSLLPSMAPIDGGTEDGVLRVDVAGPELRAIANEDATRLPLIYGQIVCSILALEDSPINTVEVFDDEGRINALPAGGEVRPIEGPVGRDSYNDCATAAEIAAAEAEAGEPAEGDEPADG